MVGGQDELILVVTSFAPLKSGYDWHKLLQLGLKEKV